MRETHPKWIDGSIIIVVALGQLGLFPESAAGGDPHRPELILPLGHTAGISAVALGADGKRAVTGSDDNTAILWDVRSGKALQAFKGHTWSITSVAMTRDCKRVLTGSLDNTAMLWDAESGQILRSFKGHTRWVDSVALSQDGARVVTGSVDNTAILWDAGSGKPLQTFKGHTDRVHAVAFTEDGKRVLTGSYDETAILWDVPTGKPIETFKGHTSGVTSVALSATGNRALIGSKYLTAILWDLGSGKPLQRFKGNSLIHSVALSANGRHAVTGSVYDPTAIVWNADNGKPLQSLKGDPGMSLSVAISGDGNQIFGASVGTHNAAVLWDADTGTRLQTFQGRTKPITSMALSADAKRVVTGSADSPGLLYADDKGVVPGSSDAPAILWDLAYAKPLRTYKGHTKGIASVALSADGNRVLTGSYDKTAILWDAASDKPLQTFRGHMDAISSVALSADGKRVLTGGLHEKTAILWNADTGKRLQAFHKQTMQGTLSVTLSADANRILTGFGTNYKGEPLPSIATLWDAVSGKPLQSFENKWHITSVGLSGDSSRVLTGTRETAILWDADSGNPLQKFKGGPSAALSRDGKRVLTGSPDFTAILWDADNGKPLQSFKGHRHGISGVGFDLGDRFVATASTDGTVRIWKPGREEPIFSFLAVGEDWLFWTPEGYYTCSPNGENLIAWKIHDDSPPGYRIVGPEQFRKQFYRPDMFRHLLRELDLGKALALADLEKNRPVAEPSSIAKALPPVVLITRPDRDGEVNTETVTVEAVAVSVGDHPVTRMRLVVDDRPYEGNLSTFDVPTPKLGKVKRSWNVELGPGYHTVRVIAENAVSSEGRSDVLRLRRKAVVETLPRLFVLAVGISGYEKEALRKGVYYSAADARKFADTIEASSKPLYREVRVTRLLDGDATRQKILRELTKLKKLATQNDTVVIFFAGHGKRDEQNNFYFLPVEVDLDDLASTGLSEGDFKAAVKALPGRVVLLLDACHSGALIENDRRTGDGLTDRLYRDLTSNEYGLVMMCSSKGGEVSKESAAHKGGLFTVAVVEGLQGKARKVDGAVYLKALDDYVTERLRELSEGQQHPLTSRPPTISDIALTRP